MLEGSAATHSLEWIDRSGRLRARAFLEAQGPKAFVLKAGAIMWQEATPSLPNAGKERRREALAEPGLLVADEEHPGCWRLTQDRTFTSLSAAAQFVIGQSAQGPKWWTPISEAATTEERDDSVNDPRTDRALEEIERFLAARDGFEQAMVDFRRKIETLIEEVLSSQPRPVTYSISSRVKGTQSLFNKLLAEESPDLESIKDVVGVRVMLYSNEDAQLVNLRFQQKFLATPSVPTRSATLDADDNTDEQHPSPADTSLEDWCEQEAYNLVYVDNREHARPESAALPHAWDSATDASASSSPYYQAHHWWWRYEKPDEALTLPGGSMRSARPGLSYGCELQVVHVTDHVINEVLHDLIYKEGIQERLSRGDRGNLNIQLRHLVNGLDAVKKSIDTELLPFLLYARRQEADVDR